jgi:hypothetical protein
LTRFTWKRNQGRRGEKLPLVSCAVWGASFAVWAVVFAFEWAVKKQHASILAAPSHLSAFASATNLSGDVVRSLMERFGAGM